VRLELLHGLGAVIDEGEAGGLAATELGAETEDGDLVLLGLVKAGELVAEVLLGDVGTTGVEDVTAHAQGQQPRNSANVPDSAVPPPRRRPSSRRPRRVGSRPSRMAPEESRHGQILDS